MSRKNRIAIADLLRAREQPVAAMLEHLPGLLAFGSDYERAYADAAGPALVLVLVALGVPVADLFPTTAGDADFFAALRERFVLSEFLALDSVAEKPRRPLLDLANRVPGLTIDSNLRDFLESHGTDYEGAYRDAKEELLVVMLALGAPVFDILGEWSREQPTPTVETDDDLRRRFPLATVLAALEGEP